MSAIWGIINNNGDFDSSKYIQPMQDALGVYKLDSINTWMKNNSFMGCGLQFITPESLHEKLPYYDVDGKLAITADAIIDNREELFKTLCVDIGGQQVITDSELIILAYKKWGKRCPEYLVGDFTFVIWDEGNDEIFCVRDHVGARTFYYLINDYAFSFCTLLKPLTLILDKIELNERWITDFLSLPGVIHQSEFKETIYNNIFQLPPAHSMTISNKGVSLHKYWNPQKEVMPLKLKTDDDYYKAFLSVFREAVRCRLRCNGEVGITLSGGLDSGSVATIAAEELKKTERRLKAFSFIPLSGIEYNLPKDRIADESEYINLIKNKAGNIDVTYCRCEGQDSYNKIDKLTQIFEQPYKTIENAHWADELYKTAANNGCKIILSGQYGNTTISFGEFLAYMVTLIKKGRIHKIIKEINDFSKVMRLPRKYVSKVVISAIFPYRIKRLIRPNKEDKFRDALARGELLKKWDVKRRFEKDGFITAKTRFYDFKKLREMVTNPIAFTQIGMMETKNALAYNILTRDPTKDKRIIEFCLSLPDEQFVSNGIQRRLIRNSMKGILPEKVRMNLYQRGIQYADWIYRLINSRDGIIKELEIIRKNKLLDYYVDVEKIDKELELLKDKSIDIKGCNIRMLIISIVFARFIKNEQFTLSLLTKYEEMRPERPLVEP